MPDLDLPFAVGDYVKSEKFTGVVGFVQDIAPCANVRCPVIELTLDPKEPGSIQFYYHADHFVKTDIPKPRVGQ